MKHPFKKILLFILLAVCLPWRGAAENYTYNYTANCNTAYQCYMSLHFAEAQAAIRREVVANPYNLMATYISDYEDCLVLLLNCSNADYAQRKDHFDERLSLLDKGNSKDPWYRLCKAGLYLHWALVRIRFGENFKAGLAFRKSYSLLKENKELFPNFEYNNIFYGLEEAVVGTVPKNYKWLATVLGLKGNVKSGVDKLTTFMNTHNSRQPLHTEAVLYWCYLQFFLNSKQQEVWSYLNSEQWPVKNNLLNAYVRANMGINFRKADVAIQTLQAAQKENGYSAYPIFDYDMGSALMAKLDPACIGYLQRFIKNNTCNVYIKDAWQKLALTYYLQKNTAMAESCRKKARDEGSTQIDADKQAARFGNSTNWPNPILLQARLLIDGGYPTEALSKLKSINEAQLADAANKAEYNYRMGCVYEDMRTDGKALQYFQQAVIIGKGRPEQFAARAALHMGLVYEHSGHKADAIAKYHETLDMPDHDFQNSIDQQAKAGLNRLNQNQ